MITVNTEVKFKIEEEPGENRFKMIAIEVNGDRCKIAIHAANLAWPLIRIVRTDDLIEVKNK